MLEPPSNVSDQSVLDAVRSGWGTVLDDIVHLPLGFGAHHWRAAFAGRPRLFVTLDQLRPRHTAESLEAAYRAAGALADQGLEFVVPTLRTREGHRTVALGSGRLSCTPWLDGTVAGPGPLSEGTGRLEGLVQANVAAISRLHRASPPAGIPRWRPLVEADFADRLAESLDRDWDTGPYGERVRLALARHAGFLARWTLRYHQLALQASSRPWVPTHGEPHTSNQLVTGEGVRFVDWESLTLAPRERDLRTLVDAGQARLVRPHWPMIEMFDLEWRLDEVSQYAAWFAAAHDGDANDKVAFTGLLEELERPDWREPS